MPLLAGFEKLIFPFPCGQGQIGVVARNEGTTSNNLTHV